MKLLDIFPVPSYLKIPAVGFDISDQSIKYVELYNRSDLQLASFGRKSFPSGIIESGQIKKTEEMIDILRNIRKEIKNDYIIVALPEEKIFIGNIKMPLMREDEIRSSLELQIEEHIPLSAKEVIFDYEIIEEGLYQEKGKKEYLDVCFSAVPIEIAESYRDVLIKAGFKPLAFETEPHALARVLINRQEKKPQMIIDFGKTRTSFVIIDRNRIELTSTIRTAGESLDFAISKALSVSIEEGRLIKEEKGILPAIIPIISQIKNETQKQIMYWKDRALKNGEEGSNIEKIILCGGDASLIGLTEYLSKELGIFVEVGNPWININSFEKHIPKMDFEESLSYATALGLALRSFSL